MTTIKIDKWIEGTFPDDCVRDVARQTLQARLAAVRHFLPLAAEKSDEQLRRIRHALILNNDHRSHVDSQQ